LSATQDLLTADASLAEGFKRVRFLVLDEADRLLEPTFESELRIIAGALPVRRQTLLFSATLTRSLALLQASSLKDAFLFQVRPCLVPFLGCSLPLFGTFVPFFASR
jgi:ATP-dependent RNA helicase DDX49/DBP8